MKVLAGFLAAILAVVLAGSGWLVWRKWPLTASDLEKVCRVDEFAGCTDEGQPEFSICELEYFDRALSSRQVFDEPRLAGRPGIVAYGDYLRERAAAEGLPACPKADRLAIVADSIELCSIPALESCLRIDPDPAACGRFHIRSSAGVDIRKKLMETADVRKRADIVQGFATAIRPAAKACAAIDPLQVELDRREQQREDALRIERTKDKVGILASATYIEGPLETSFVAKLIRGQLADLQVCYDNARRKGLTTKGTLGFHFTLPAAGGHPRQPELETGTFQDATLIACAIKMLKKLSFPAADGPTDASVGFTFQ